MDQSIFQAVPIQYYFILSACLFCIGLFGLLYRNNAIIVFLCVELMFNAINLLLVALSKYKADPQAEIFVFFIMAVAAVEVAIGLSILVSTYRNTLSVELDKLNKLKE